MSRKPSCDRPVDRQPGVGGGVVVVGAGVIVVGDRGPDLSVVRSSPAERSGQPTANASGAAERDVLPAAPSLAAGG